LLGSVLFRLLYIILIVQYLGILQKNEEFQSCAAKISFSLKFESGLRIKIAWLSDIRILRIKWIFDTPSLSRYFTVRYCL